MNLNDLLNVEVIWMNASWKDCAKDNWKFFSCKHYLSDIVLIKESKEIPDIEGNGGRHHRDQQQNKLISLEEGSQESCVILFPWREDKKEGKYCRFWTSKGSC